MADETQIEAWKNEALVLADDEHAAQALVLRIYEAGRADRSVQDAETIGALERELAKLRRSVVSAGS